MSDVKASDEGAGREKPALERVAWGAPDPKGTISTVSVVRRVLRLRRVSAVGTDLRLLGHREDLHLERRGYRARRMFGMTGELLAAARRCARPRSGPAVFPIPAVVGEDLGDFLVGQSFVPGLHHGGTIVLALNGDRALQALEHDHRRPAPSTD